MLEHGTGQEQDKQEWDWTKLRCNIESVLVIPKLSAELILELLISVKRLYHASH